VFSADLPILSALLRAEPNLELKVDGETPFAYAVRLRRFEAARLLAEAGADLSSPNRAGETPLQLACRRGYPKAVLNWLNGVGLFPNAPA
jgi:ankyrin repeat protein